MLWMYLLSLQLDLLAQETEVETLRSGYTVKNYKDSKRDFNFVPETLVLEQSNYTMYWVIMQG